LLFLIVKAAQALMPPKVTQRDCPHCRSSIPIGASACAFCTRDVQPAT
jgi:hypothetical protein